MPIDAQECGRPGNGRLCGEGRQPQGAKCPRRVWRISTETATAHASKANIRAAATQFAHNWREAESEQAERQSFWNAFFQIFGVDRRRVAAFERLAERASTGNRGWIDMLNPGQMAVEHKSAGEDLDAAMGQLIDYLPSLTEAEMPWLLVVCDFQRFKWENLDTGERGEFALAELPDHIELFWWIAGYNRPHQTFGSDEDANLAATRLLANVHDRLAEHGYPAHDLREWMTRILFILFADDTGIWDRAAFHTYIALHTKQDGSDLGPTIALIFEVLNTPPADRQSNLDEDLASLTYVNGDLFADTLRIPVCDKDTRDALLWASVFNWASISPAVFGSLFQNVMEPAERRQLGAHYTTEQNILRTIRPLFLDVLEAELDAARTKPALKRFIDRLGELTFFDPACGCGNFLVIAYRELRRLETEALRRLREKEGTGQLQADVTLDLRLTVDQFYGIELEEFPARIARTALYLADHIANRELSAEFGQHVVRFPIPSAPHILIDNALRTDWSELLPAEKCSFVFGNPPYVGKHLLTADQRSDIDAAFDGSRNSGTLDYVAGWFRTAARYTQSTSIRGAFVATNSLTQGEQVPILWPHLHAIGMHIAFAWRTFEWRNDASGMAHVHVVIIGFENAMTEIPGDIYESPSDRASDDPPPARAGVINGYLIDAPETYPAARTSPIVNHVPAVVYGSKPVDSGHLLLTGEEASQLRTEDPVAAQFIRPMYSTTEFVNGRGRYCLWLENAAPNVIRSSPELRRRLEEIREFRRNSSKASTQLLAETPGVFGEIRNPTTDFIFVPIHVSGNRRLIPMGFVGAEERAVVHNSGAFIEGGDLALFGLLQSAWFTAWQAVVGGRIKSDFRFNNRLVYNTFPFPVLDEAQSERIGNGATAVLDARASHPSSSLADLYDPIAQPADLVAAHVDLDRAVDRVFNPAKRRWTDADRMSLLLERYSELLGSLPSTSARKTRPKRRPARRS